VSEYRFAVRTDRDLRDIYLYGVEQFGHRQAQRYRGSLDRCFSLLAENPRMGRLSPTVRPGIRRHEHGSHVILYRERKDYILIVAIVHGRSIRGLEV
jgi:toxin ParE1/3/4